MTGPYALQRFRTAQDEQGTYGRAVAELRAGCKSSHWMWFVFPQLAGLGRSEMARRFAIASLDEARAYVADDVLGGRLLECALVLLDLGQQDAERIFGAIDAMKLRSSMTLFALAVPHEPVFAAVLERFFGGRRDEATERLLG